MRATNTLVIGALVAVSIVGSGCQGRGDGKKEVAQAQAMIGRGDYKSAIIEAKNALQKNAQNADARLLLGRALLETGDAAASEVELRKALEAGATESKVLPWLAKAEAAQGQFKRVILEFAATTLPDAAAGADLKTTVAAAYAQLGELDNARDAVQSALKDWPAFAPASLLQARLLAASGDTAGALALVGPVLEREPKNVAALLLKADLQRLGLHDPGAALATYRLALAADPKALRAHAAIISMLLDEQDVAAARAQYERLKAVLPDHPETLLFEAQFAYLDKNFARTRELTDQLRKPFPDDPRILRLAGSAALRMNALGQAESDLSQALKAAPQVPSTRELLAQIYLRTGQSAKALEVLKPVLDSKSASAAALTLAGQAYLQTGDLAKSEASFASAAKADPKSVGARTALAVTQMALGKVDTGMADLEALAASDTGSVADMALISARMRRHDLAGALEAVDALEKKQPDKPIAPMLRGTIQLQQKNPDAARASFEKALAIDKLYFPATASLAALDLAAGKPQAAKQRFEDVLRADPKNFRAMLGLAELEVRTGASKAEVTKSIAAAIAANPVEPAPRLFLVNYLLAQQDAPAALAAAQDASAVLPNNAEITERLGAAQLAAGSAQQAVTTYTKLAALQPGRTDTQLHLADAQAAAGDLDSAKRTLQEALSLHPGLAPAQLRLAAVAMRQKRPDEALAISRAMQKAQPKSAAGDLLEAEVESRQGQAANAVASLRRALALDARSEIAVKLHQALLAAGRKDEADRLLASWQRDHPHDAALNYYLGDLALARGDLAGAESNYRGVIEVQPDNALALNNVAWLMTRQGQPGAAAMAERANKLLPDRPALMDTWALALAAENQTPRAIELQKKAIDEHPDSAELRLTLAKIYIKAGDRQRARDELDRLARLGDKFPAQAEVSELLKAL